MGIEVIAVLIMIGGAGGILYGVLKGTLALSFRTIQFLIIAAGVPAIMLLSLERGIGSDATSALLGVIVGYALSGIGRSE
jgi:hypothetical protein